METTPSTTQGEGSGITEHLPLTRMKIYILIGAAVLVLIVAGVALWLAHPYFKEMRVIQAGEQRKAILDKNLPDNPAAQNLTFEERQQILQNLGPAE